jgi:ABC-2 type transport system permease protein
MIRIRSRAIYLFTTLILPISSFLIFLAIFSAGVIREMPAAVVDLDQTALSRQLVRMIDASPSVTVKYRPMTLGEGESLMYKSDVYACVVIPKNFERDVNLLRAPKVYNYYNNQYLLIGGTMYKEVYAAVKTLSAGVSISARMKKGEPYSQVMTSIQPIEVQTHVLFNPYTNYLYYLAGSLLPNMLHIFVILTAILAFGSELKDKTAGELWRMSGGSFMVTVIGKYLPYLVIFMIDALLMHTLLFKFYALPLRGSFDVILLATFMFILAYLAMGLFYVTVAAHLRMALMAASFYASTAYTFIGMTFPIIAFPVPAKIWAYCLPLTHFMKIFINESIAGIPHSFSIVSFLFLCIFILLPCTVAFRFRRIMSEEKYWGKQ